MSYFGKSNKLNNVRYAIRGPIFDEAKKLEKYGYELIKLNIGNPAPFGLYAPPEIIRDVIHNLRVAQGYSESQGIFAARKAIMQYYQQKNVLDVDVDDIYTGNGVSELISIAMQALLNDGDEILVPAPDYPLWTASISLSGGTPVHYLCDEQADWCPDLADIRRKITPRTKGIVIINPNNPTGALYPGDMVREIVKIAEEHKLIVFSDEIYDKIIYDKDAVHVSPASLSEDVFFVTFNGLSKSHRIAGFRAGWMVVSGNKAIAEDYIEGLKTLSSMRLCSNVPAQYTIQTALGGYQSLTELLIPGGRLYKQREACYELLTSIPGISCVKPKGAFYMFPKIDVKRFNITSDYKFVLDFLREKKVMLVEGTGFNWPEPDHFRVVYLAPVDVLTTALNRLADFLVDYNQTEEEIEVPPIEINLDCV
ncbi:MAG TPA: pyridoxal phosphate-dependent aminotransferase [Clostridia bacterium]|jgi:alanine-synthesizing transaminase|nr:pyridoxal phosphate-dependent aminotransferase [Clostridia bacterium]HOB82594.1 pyridoxal phosphate-dependent aminotransferase [Peptococcaceae bacterium]HPZ70679.1 pyridoxal phosphate-dependent aminotransferase [Peptococcaceae bacterium]